MILSEKDFANSIKPGLVFYFTTVDVHSTIPHYFVIINKNLKTSPILILPVATSQLKRRERYYSIHSLEREALVIIDHEKTNGILSKQSAFDCNFTTTKTIEELYEINIKGKLKYAGTLSDDIIEKLRNGVKVAKQVENWIKELV